MTSCPGPASTSAQICACQPHGPVHFHCKHGPHNAIVMAMTLLPPVWHSATGAPTLLAWVMAAAYAVAAVQCVRAALRMRRPIPLSLDQRFAWWACAAALGFLGVNKLVAFQTLAFHLGRGIALRGGWYGQRRVVQGLFAAIMLLGLLTCGLFAWRKRISFTQEQPVAAAGVVCLLLYVVVRAADFTHVLEMMHINLHNDYWIWVLEGSGILCIAHSATTFVAPDE